MTLTALSADQLGQLHGAGCSLVWPPRSNPRLYGETTLAAEALRLGMPPSEAEAPKGPRAP